MDEDPGDDRDDGAPPTGPCGDSIRDAPGPPHLARLSRLGGLVALGALLAADPGCRRQSPSTGGAAASSGSSPSNAAPRTAESTTAPPMSAETLAAVSAPAVLHVVAWRDGPLDLRALDDGTVVVNAGLAMAMSRDGGPLVHDAAWLRGMRDPGSTYGVYAAQVLVGGRWPDNAWLAERSERQGSASDWRVYRWERDAWTSILSPPATSGDANDARGLWYYIAFVPWRDGMTLGLRVEEPGRGGSAPIKPDQRAHARFEVLAPGKPPSPPGAFGAPVDVPGEGAPEVLAGLPSGEVFAAVGGTATSTEITPRMAVWKRGAAAPEVEMLPRVETASPVSIASLVAISPNEAYAAGVETLLAEGNLERPYLARYDPRALSPQSAGHDGGPATPTHWTRIEAPFGTGIVSMAASPEGVLWAAARSEEEQSARVPSRVGELRRKLPGKDWERVGLPAATFPQEAVDHPAYDEAARWHIVPGDPKAATAEWRLSPQAVVARGAGDVWVVARAFPPEGRAVPPTTDPRWVALRTRDVGTPLILPDKAVVRLELDDLGALRFARPGAKRVAAGKDGKDAKDCAEVFLELEEVPTDAPASYDPVKLRTALAGEGARIDPGWLGCETVTRGRRVIGFWSSYCDDACLYAMSAIGQSVAKKSPGRTTSTPRAYCRTPVVTREVAIAPKP